MISYALDLSPRFHINGALNVPTAHSICCVSSRSFQILPYFDAFQNRRDVAVRGQHVHAHFHKSIIPFISNGSIFYLNSNADRNF